MFYSGLVILLFVIYHLLHFTLGVVYSQGYRSQDNDARPVAASKVPEAHHEVFIDSNGRYVDARSHGVFLDSKGRHDVYSMFIQSFQQPLITFTYVIAMLFLGAHLIHGINSMFQTTGFNRPAYNTAIRVGGPIVVFLIVLGNCMMPLTILLLNYPALPGKAG